MLGSGEREMAAAPSPALDRKTRSAPAGKAEANPRRVVVTGNIPLPLRLHYYDGEERIEREGKLPLTFVRGSSKRGLLEIEGAGRDPYLFLLVPLDPGQEGVEIPLEPRARVILEVQGVPFPGALADRLATASLVPAWAFEGNSSIAFARPPAEEALQAISKMWSSPDWTHFSEAARAVDLAAERGLLGEASAAPYVDLSHLPFLARPSFRLLEDEGCSWEEVPPRISLRWFANQDCPFDVVPQGPPRSAIDSSDPPMVSGPFTLLPGEERVFCCAYQTGILTGRVEPLPVAPEVYGERALATLFRTESTTIGGQRVLVVKEVDQRSISLDGTFRFDGVQPGTYRLRLQWRPVEDEVHLATRRVEMTGEILELPPLRASPLRITLAAPEGGDLSEWTLQPGASVPAEHNLATHVILFPGVETTVVGLFPAKHGIHGVSLDSGERLGHGSVDLQEGLVLHVDAFEH